MSNHRKAFLLAIALGLAVLVAACSFFREPEPSMTSAETIAVVKVHIEDRIFAGLWASFSDEGKSCLEEAFKELLKGVDGEWRSEFIPEERRWLVESTVSSWYVYDHSATVGVVTSPYNCLYIEAYARGEVRSMNPAVFREER